MGGERDGGRNVVGDGMRRSEGNDPGFITKLHRKHERVNPGERLSLRERNKIDFTKFHTLGQREPPEFIFLIFH